MNKQTLLLGVVALTTGALLYTSVGTAYAQEGANFTSIVQRIAERFNLDESEVQQVFDEAHEDRHQMMKEHRIEHLDEAMENGDITAEQKQAILDKHNEMKTNMEELKDLTHEERHEAMQALHKEMQQWLDDNDISLSFMDGRHKGPMGHHRMMGGFRK